MKAKKSLGQHFLRSASILQKIVNSLEINENDTIVEIGPGHGELTQIILTKNPKELIVIEKDEELTINLRQAFNNIQIISGDALECLPKTNLPNNWKLIGNIPYYITGRLLRAISELPSPPLQTVLLIQKEVAERISACPPKANLLSSVTSGWATAKYLFTVSRRNFRPVPKVDSAVISLRRNNLIADNNFFVVTRALFKQPRKKAINNFADFLNTSKPQAEKIFISCNLSLDLRSQNLSPENIICLSKKILNE